MPPLKVFINSAVKTNSKSDSVKKLLRILTVHSVWKGLVVFSGLLALLMMSSAIIIHWNLDLYFSSFFYQNSNWFLKDEPPWTWLYQYGTIPGTLFSLGALGLWSASYIQPRFTKWRYHLLLICLTAFLGGGILVNAVLKDYWGRPRPREVQQFQGNWEYRHMVNPGIPGKGRSFPCGHCTMGYLFTTLFFFRSQSKRIAYVGGGIGVVYGIVMSLTRMVQGGHFFSDTLWSFGVIMLFSTALYYWVLRIPDRRLEEIQTIDFKRWLILGSGVLTVFVLVVLAFSARRPYFRTYFFQYELMPNIERLSINVNVETTQNLVHYHPQPYLEVKVSSQGYGWTSSETSADGAWMYSEGIANLDLQVEPQGYFAELTHEVVVLVPLWMKDRLKVNFLIEK